MDRTKPPKVAKATITTTIHPKTTLQNSVTARIFDQSPVFTPPQISVSADEFPNTLNNPPILSSSHNVTKTAAQLTNRITTAHIMSFRSKPAILKPSPGENRSNTIATNPSISKKSLKLARLQKSLKSQRF
jgi:hypothetical protein